MVFDPKKVGKHNNCQIQLVDVVISPISLHLTKVQEIAGKNIRISAQNCSQTGMGAYTGEISIEHLKDVGINWTLTGHSERRQYYGDTSKIVG